MPRSTLSLLLAVLLVTAGCAGIPGSTPTATSSTTPDGTATTSASATTAASSTPTTTSTLSTTASRTTTADYTQAIEEDVEIENRGNTTANVTVRVLGPDNETAFNRTVSLSPGESRTFNVSYADHDYQHGDDKYRFVASQGDRTATRHLGTPAEYLVEVTVHPDDLRISVLAA